MEKKALVQCCCWARAYGVLEEGLLVTSFFSPYWQDSGAMAVYGRWLGVNWVWAEMLTIYHAVFSIVIPIRLVELAYPQRSAESCVGNKLFKALLAVLFTLTALGFFLFSSMMNYWTPAPQYLFGIALMLFFILLARRLPTEWEHQGQKTLSKPIMLWFVAAAAGFAFFLGFWLLPFTAVPWAVTMMYGPLLIFLMVKFLKRFNWREKTNDMHVFALCSER